MAACRRTPRPRTTSARSRPTRTSTADSPLSRPPRSLARLPGPSHTARCDMTNGLSSPKATDRPPGPTPQAARGAPPPSDAFAGMLDAHQARTAIAEGRSESPERPARDAAKPAPVKEHRTAPSQPKDARKDHAADAARATDAGDATDAADAADATDAAQAALLAAALPSPIEAPVAPVAEAAAATQMVVAGGAPTPVVQVVTPAQT